MPSTGRRRLRWLLLAAIPSGLLSAVTNFIATDLVSAPFLWVVPLAHLSRVVHRRVLASRRPAHRARRRRCPGHGHADVGAIRVGRRLADPCLLAVELVAFVVIATALHGRLAQDRPDPDHLTEFYLIISTGWRAGVCVRRDRSRPNVFPDVWEYPILLVGALAALALVADRAMVAWRGPGGLDFGPFFAGLVGRLLPYVVAGAGCWLGSSWLRASSSIEAGDPWLRRRRADPDLRWAAMVPRRRDGDRPQRSQRSS